MGVSKKTRVLVVDDSLVFREMIVRGIENDRGIEVVATAANPFEARDKIIEFKPDVMTLDVEMPRMGGIEFLRRLMPQYPLPVVVVSSVNDNVFEALDAGAVDFVTKPDVRFRTTLEGFINELVVKIKIASISKVGHNKSEYVGSKIAGGGNIKGVNTKSINTIIAIGASTGGTEAIYEVVRAFPRDMPGVVITQHMPAAFTQMYANRLNNSCEMEVKEAQHGDAIVQGRILIAPGDYQMKVNKRGTQFVVECLKGEKVNGHCPSVDVLFDSVAEKVGADAIGVILTGMGSDGAKGLLKMKQKGAITIGQDEQSSVVYGMPKVAYDIGAVGKKMPLKNIANEIHSILLRK